MRKIRIRNVVTFVKGAKRRATFRRKGFFEYELGMRFRCYLERSAARYHGLACESGCLAREAVWKDLFRDGLDCIDQ